MPNDNDTRELSLAEGLQTFCGRSRGSQVAVVVGGFLVWIAAYAVSLAVLGGETAAITDSPGAIRARRNATAIAGAAIGLYFGALWTRARGGPLLNIVYLVGVQLLVPDRAYALGGTPPEHVVSGAESAFILLFADPTWILDRAITVFPSFVVFALVLVFWGMSLRPAEQNAFVEDHLPKAWLDLRKAEQSK